MRKTVFTLMMLLGVATFIASCKKEEKQTEKERVTKLLTSGKWYYRNFRTQECFDTNDYWEFNADRTFAENWDFGDGTYTVSEDGKSIALNFGKYTMTIADISIAANTFSFKLEGGESSYNVVLANTPDTDCPFTRK